MIPMDNSSFDSVPHSGYDLPVYGLSDGQFYNIHIPAMSCIFVSFCSGVAVLIASFRFQSYRKFFSWCISERFLVYLALCDVLFNISHSMDHLHIVLTRDHVYPKELCEFYGFMLAVFMSAQHLLVNVIAFNAFTLIYYHRQLKFGKRDWKLLLYTFGVPFGASIIAVHLGTLGPNGTFCYFDSIKGEVANIFFTTVPLLLVLVMNISLYFFTWRRINKESKELKDVLGENAGAIRACHRAAGTMTIFVLAFLLQWWAMAIYGIWQLAEDVPRYLFQFVTTFSNTGGIINGVVFIIIRRRKKGNMHKLQRLSSPIRMPDGVV